MKSDFRVNLKMDPDGFKPLKKYPGNIKMNTKRKNIQVQIKLYQKGLSVVMELGKIKHVTSFFIWFCRTHMQIFIPTDITKACESAWE